MQQLLFPFTPGKDDFKRQSTTDMEIRVDYRNCAYTRQVLSPLFSNSREGPETQTILPYFVQNTFFIYLTTFSARKKVERVFREFALCKEAIPQIAQRFTAPEELRRPIASFVRSNIEHYVENGLAKDRTIQEPERQKTKSFLHVQKNTTTRRYTGSRHGAKIKCPPCLDENNIDYLNVSDTDSEIAQDYVQTSRTKKKNNFCGD